MPRSPPLKGTESRWRWSSLSLHYPLRCGGASLSWSHCCTWKIRYNQGLIRFGLWIWVTWLQVEYPTIWGLNPTMKILNFFFSLISLYNNRNQWQLQRSIFKRITLFIELQVQHIIYFQTQLCSFIIVNVFSLFVQNMGTSPQSLALRINISIASADPSSKKNWIICFHRLLNHQCIAKLITGVELKEGPCVSMTSL